MTAEEIKSLQEKLEEQAREIKALRNCANCEFAVCESDGSPSCERNKVSRDWWDVCEKWEMWNEKIERQMKGGDNE